MVKSMGDDKKEGGGHTIRPVMGSDKKIHVRVDCENCGRYECLTIYEDHVEDVEFKLSFFECPNCKKSFCHICIKEDDALECPFCKRLKPKKIKPFDIYVCGVCFREWWKEGGLCNKCFYIPDPKEDPEEGHYKGPK